MGRLKLREQLEINGRTALLSKGQVDTLQLNDWMPTVSVRTMIAQTVEMPANKAFTAYDKAVHEITKPFSVHTRHLKTT